MKNPIACLCGWLESRSNNEGETDKKIFFNGFVSITIILYTWDGTHFFSFCACRKKRNPLINWQTALPVWINIPLRSKCQKDRSSPSSILYYEGSFAQESGFISGFIPFRMKWFGNSRILYSQAKHTYDSFLCVSVYSCIPICIEANILPMGPINTLPSANRHYHSKIKYSTDVEISLARGIAS